MPWRSEAHRLARLKAAHGTFKSMSVNEELNEGAEHAKEPFDRKVAVTMAIIAALLAIVTVLGHIVSTEELLAQQKANDQWAYYQAKSIRRYNSEIARDLLKTMNADSPQAADHYAANVLKYEKEGQEVQTEAKHLEAESEFKGKQALRLEISEVFLEIGIVFASLAILSKRSLVWGASMLSAAVGVCIALTTKFIA
jgi:hypothetical protein